MNWKVFLLIIAFITPLLAHGQQQRTILYNVENGLTTDVIKCLTQDNDGFIWMGSDEGLMRFDGKNIISYSNALPSNYIKGLLKTKSGRILVVHDLGISEIFNKPDTTYFRNLVKGMTDMNSPNDSTVIYPKSLYEDINHNIWAGDQNSIIKITGKKIRKYKFSNENSTNSFTRSFCFVEDGFGRLWTTSFPGKLFYYNTASDSFNEVSLNTDIPWVNALIQIQPGRIWMGAALGIYEILIHPNGKVLSINQITNTEGVSCFMGNKTEGVYFGSWSRGLFKATVLDKKVLINKVDAFSSGTINNLFSGQTGEYWVCSNEGAGLMQTTFFATLPLEDQRVLSGDTKFIQSITEGYDGNLYVSVGIAIFRIRKEKGQINPELLMNWGTGFIARIVADQNGLWIGDSFGEIHYYDFKKHTLITIKGSKIGRYSNFVSLDKKGNLWSCQEGYKGAIKINPQHQIFQYTLDKGIGTELNVIKEGTDQKIYAVSKTDTSYLYVFDETTGKFKNISKPLTVVDKTVFEANDLAVDKFENIWLASTIGLFKYNKNGIERINLGRFHTNEPVKSVIVTDDGNIWMANSLGIIKIVGDTLTLFNKQSGLPVNTITSRNLYIDKENTIWVGTVKGIAYTHNIHQKMKLTPSPLLLNLKNNTTDIEFSTNRIPSFPHGSFLEINYISIAFPSEKILYQTRLIGEVDSWSLPQKKSEAIIPQLSQGTYTLQIRAQKQGENYEWSTPISYKFKIQPAWYQTWWAILSGLGLSFFLVWGIIRLYTLRLKKDKIKLEIIVNERTAVIEKQKEELTQQATEMIQTNTEMNIKKIELEKAYLNIEETNKNITDSINYASRIQAALLPSLEQIQKAIPDSFIFYQPREIVSGDYYWFVIKKQKIFIAAVDCTGHGVPGAFMSMIGHSFLNQIVNTNNIFQPELILKELHIRVKNALKQDETQVRDGMDIALCVIDVRRNILEFAGAKRPLIYIQDNQLFQIKGDPNAIGGRLKGDENIFTKKTIDISVPTCIYLMSDGFQDQFGGEANKKFTQKKLMDILKEIYPETMSKQYELLHNTFYEWKGTRRQIDDILLIGLQIGPNSIHINLKDEFNWSDKTILIAEDMNLNYLVIKNILSSTLANLVWVRNGQEAIDIIKGNTHIDLVLMDYDMPVKSGIEAINSIREFNQTLPIIVQTAYTHTGVREQSFKAGADDYITKPINAKELLAIIQKYFN